MNRSKRGHASGYNSGRSFLEFDSFAIPRDPHPVQLALPSLSPAVSENSIHLTRSHRRIRTRSSDDCNRPLVRPYAVRLLQAATAAGSRNPNTAASAQRPAAAHAAPSTAFALGRPRPVHLALSSLPRILDAMRIVRPETVVRWHRKR